MPAVRLSRPDGRCRRLFIGPHVRVLSDAVAMTRAEAAAYWEANAEIWTQHARAGLDVYRDRVNTPAFLMMLPPIAALSGLDIGCGEGANTRDLARRGASMTALDVSPTFIRHAREAER